ncbi:tyrosine-type recombinase/integrase [Bdellovibrionota bacterium FG-2]
MSECPRRRERLQAVRNNPGIAKRFVDDGDGKFVDSGKFISSRRERLNGKSRKVRAVFDNIEDAKAFRAGRLQKTSTGSQWHRQSIEPSEGSVTFAELIKEWKAFAYLKLEASTQQTYDKLLPSLGPLTNIPVNRITVLAIDELIKHWVEDPTKSERRKTYRKELDLLRTILHHFRKRHNPAFILPVLPEHYEAADITKEAEPAVTTLSIHDLGRFFDELRTGRTPEYYPLALTQLCFCLRIGECAGLTWSAIDLKTKIARIHQTVIWDQYSWKPSIKSRPKNGKERLLMIPEILATEFEAMNKTRDPKVDLIFHNDGVPLNRKTVGTAFNRTLKRLRIGHVTGTHFLRKTSATLANEATGDLFAVQKLLDHSSPNVTMKYVASTLTQKQKMADALGGAANAAFASLAPSGPAAEPSK